jgi:hypothetical protein
VVVEETTLVVELSTEAAVDRVNVIAPDGSEFGSQTIAEGVSRAEFDIGLEYDPGTYRVVAVSGEEATGETSVEIVPDLQIEEVGVGANNLDRMPDSLGNTKSVEALVRVRNLGDGPGIIEKLLVLGDVPNPTTDLKEAPTDQVSGIFDVDSGQGEVESFQITGDNEVVLYTNSLPFSFEAGDAECTPDRYSGQFSVTLETPPRSNDVSESYEIEYFATENGNSCDIQVFGGD